MSGFTFVMTPLRMDLPVLPTLPEGVREIQPSAMFGMLRTAIGIGTWQDYYHCRHCGGWIPGRIAEFVADDQYRKGREFYCIRCGEEICFLETPM